MLQPSILGLPENHYIIRQTSYSAGLAVIKGWLIINILLISATYITYNISKGFATQQKENLWIHYGISKVGTPDETKRFSILTCLILDCLELLIKNH